MKFGKYILENAVPEWRKKYINYKALKEKIKKCTAAANNDLLNTDEVFLVNDSDDLSDDDWSKLLEGATQEDKEFVRAHQYQIERVRRFFDSSVI